MPIFFIFASAARLLRTGIEKKRPNWGDRTPPMTVQEEKMCASALTPITSSARGSSEGEQVRAERLSGF